MLTVCCGSNSKGRCAVDFSPPVKPPAHSKWVGRCWYDSPSTFVASVTSGCVPHSCEAFKRREGPDREIYHFPPWWQCPTQVHRDQCTLGAIDLPPAVNAASPFCHMLSHWNFHFEYSKLVEINLIILLNLVNRLWWRKGNRFLFSPVQFCLSVVQGPKTVGDCCLCGQLSANRQERPWEGWVVGTARWGSRPDSRGCSAIYCSLH